MLCAVGDLVEDVVVLLPGPPGQGTDTTCTVLRSRGGSAANVAVAAVRAGSQARFVGRVGDDALGDSLAARLRAAGVELAGERGGRTGSIVVLVDPAGERTMLTDRGCAPDLATADPAWLDGARALHVPAYSLAGRAIAASARALWGSAGDAIRSVDASSVGLLAERGPAWWLALLADLAPDVVFADAGEAAFLGIGDAPPPGLPLVVVKDGPRPARVLSAGAPPVAVPAVDVHEVVDTTGAGDAFAAGWIVAAMAGADPVEATAAGHAAGAEAVGRAGALA